jgi:hypothetical protein
VRVCDEIEGAHVWDLAYRGEKDKISREWISLGAAFLPVLPAANVLPLVQPGQYSARVPPFLKKRKIARSWNF